MQTKQNTQFADFLKNLYWKNISDPATKPADFVKEKPAKTKRTEYGFKNILQHLKTEKNVDIDDFSVFLWQKHHKDHLSELKKSGSGDYFNKEINHHAHIDLFFNKDKRELSLVKVSASPLMIFAGALLLAVFLTSTIVRFKPLYGQKIISLADAIIVDTIKQSYCSMSDDIYLCQPDNARMQSIAAGKIDNNILSSYIANNQNTLESLEPGTSVVVSADELDGRVAGVIESTQNSASEELENLSMGENNVNVNKYNFKQAMASAISSQKNLVIKIQNKLIGIIF